MRRLGWLVAGLVLVGLTACASTAQAPPTVDISGKWQGNWVGVTTPQGSGQIELDVKQTGSKFIGNIRVTGAPNDPTGLAEGFVTGNRVEISVPPGATGTLAVNGDDMTGTLGGMNGAKVTLKRVK